MRILLLLVWVCLGVFQLYAFVAPLNMQILLKTIYAPTLFSGYAKEYGRLYCQLYGVAGVVSAFKNEECEISEQSAKEMRHFAMTYTQNKIFLEQQYRVGYSNGWCFLQNGANLFNAQIVKDGYAVIQTFDRSAEDVLVDLERLESLAKLQKKGLWKEWGEEMECLKKTLKQIQETKE